LPQKGDIHADEEQMIKRKGKVSFQESGAAG
jgi:hypothetical protein